MSKGIYTSLSGALAQQRRVESVANNLANVNTTGYKRNDLTFKEHLSALADPEKDTPVPRMEFKPGDFYQIHGADKSFATVSGDYTDYTQGVLKLTGRELDVGIQGRGFFEVGAPQGVRLTRNGVFHISNDGTLVNDQGYPVLSKAAAAAPVGTADIEGRKIRVAKGAITITEGGDVYQNGTFLAGLQLTEPIDPSLLRREGSNLLRNDDPNNVAPGEVTSRLLQRHVEGSNVNPVQEMVTLIEAQKLFDTNMKNIQQFDSIAQKAANEIGKF